MSLYLAVRWLHVISAAAWFGEVVTINFVLVPALSRLSREEATAMLAAVFPKIFRLASVLSATAVLSGIYLAWTRFAAAPEILWTTGSGRAFSVGAILGLALTVFHFILEPRLDGMMCTAAGEKDFELSERIMRQLRVVPRGGLLVITTIVVLMMVGARGM